eukprot:355258-Chlamydomonas_euryale.AAC.1
MARNAATSQLDMVTPVQAGGRYGLCVGFLWASIRALRGNSRAVMPQVEHSCGGWCTAQQMPQVEHSCGGWCTAQQMPQVEHSCGGWYTAQKMHGHAKGLVSRSSKEVQFAPVAKWVGGMAGRHARLRGWVA